MSFLKKFHWFELILLISLLGVALYAAFSAPHNFPVRWFTRDDAYYYFKVAQNISEGRGSTFDGINLTNGYHPLWMLVCIPIFALARFDLILPLRVLLVVMAALSATTSILLFRLLKKPAGEPIAALAAAFWAFSLVVHEIVTQQGMETGIVALSTVLFLYQLQKTEPEAKLTRKNLVGLGLAALFLVFSRLDGIFLALIGGLWLVFRRTPLRYLLPIDLLLTFSVAAGAYLQRAGLKHYLLAYDNSAMLFAAVAFTIQTLVFYFVGLYLHPKNLPPLRLFILIMTGVTFSALLAGGASLALAQLGLLSLPRTVPLLYWLGMLILTLLTRFGLRSLSPWPSTLDKQQKPAQGLFADKNRLKTALEPVMGWISTGWVYFGLIGAGLLVYFGFNRLMFGTFMPVSGQIKRWWGSMPNDVYGGAAKSILDVFALDPLNSQSWAFLTNPLAAWATSLAKRAWDFDGWYWSLFAALLLGWLALCLRNRRKNLRRIFLVGLLPLLVSAEFQALTYGAMAYSAKHEWYWVTQMLSLVLLGALGLAMLSDLFPRGKTAQITAWALSGLASLYLAATFTFEIVQRMPYQDALAGQPYMDTLVILEDFTEPGAIIGMTGGGNSGYYIQGRTIVNMDGLINSYAYFQAMQANRGGAYLAERGLNYIFANPYIITSSMPYRQQFTPDELTPVEGAPVYGQKELMHFKFSR